MRKKFRIIVTALLAVGILISTELFGVLAGNVKKATENFWSVQAEAAQEEAAQEDEADEDISEEPEVEPTQKPVVKKINAVKGVELKRYSTSKIKVTWKTVKKAKYYRVYYSKKKNGKYRLAGVTKESHYLVKKLKKNTKYYFYIQAAKKKKADETDSVASKIVSMKTKQFSRKTVFAGDSITEGISYSGAPMHIGGKRDVVAYRGLNTVTFHTKRVFNGKTGLQRVIEQKPYRLYMMLGMNEIHYRNIKDMLAEYKEMLREIKSSCPDTDVVLCAVSPVTKAQLNARAGFKQIPKFNKALKKLAKKMNFRYLDYTSILKDTEGCLRTDYAEADGYHWKTSVYTKFAKYIEKYDKALDD